MNKKYTKSFILYISTLFLVLGCNNEQINENNTLEKLGLNGKVKSIKIVIYGFIDKNDDGTILENEKVNQYKTFTSFNTNGNEIERIKYNRDGSLDSKDINKYDDRGNRIELVVSDFKNDIEVKFLEKYDLKGNKIEQKCFNKKGELFSKEIIKNNINGFKVERKVFNKKGENNYIELFNYDDLGNKIERKVYSLDSKGEFFFRCKIFIHL